MSMKSWYSTQPVEVKVAVAGGLVALVGGIVTGTFSLVNAKISNPPPPAAANTAAPRGNPFSTPSATTSPSPSPAVPTSIVAAQSASPTCAAKLRITTPAAD